MPLTPKEFLASLDGELKSDSSRTAGVTAIFQFEVSGPDGGHWWIEANRGSGSVSEGDAAGADLTVRMTDEVMVAMATGELDGTEAYFNGQLEIEGDQSKVGFLPAIFGEE